MASMLSGDRRLAPTRKSGMTVLGKVPKPINLPSQRLENHGLDPNVQIVPKGTITWGSRPSLTAPNAWGTTPSGSSPNADGSLGSPSGTRPSTAGSDRSHEPVSSAWGPYSRPSSASGILASDQLSVSSSRPRSAETRPGSSQLSRFAENSVDNTVAWGAAGTAERLGAGPSKKSGFNLSSGDFPTLGSDKNSDTHSQRGHSSQGRPHSSQGRPLSSHNRPTSASGPESRRNDFVEPQLTGDKNTDPPNHGTVNTWKADNSHYPAHAPPPNMDNWHRDPHHAPPYPNMNMPPPHYDSWHNPQFRPILTDGSWYNRGGPYRQPSSPGNYPIDYPPGPPRPLYCEPYPRPYMPPERFMGPSHPDIRPGSFPRPMPHEGYYGPPRPNFYNPADREASIMGMAPPPVVHNQYPIQNQNYNPANFHARPGGYATIVMNNELRQSDHPHDNQGQYRVLLKQHDGPEDQKRDWGTRSQIQETMESDSQSRDNAVKNTGLGSSKAADEGLLKKPEATDVKSRDMQQYPVIKKNPTLLERVEGLNNKARIADSQIYSKEKQTADNVAIPKELTVSTEEKTQESSNYGKDSENAQFMDQNKTHVTKSADDRDKQKPNRHAINNEWMEKVPGSDSSVTKSDASSLDPIDHRAQRAKMKEIAVQRAKQLQQEEEERTMEQKAKALAKLEELNRRTLAESSNLKSSHASPGTIDVQNSNKQEPQNSVIPTSEAIPTDASGATSAINSEIAKHVDDSDIKKPVLSTDFSSNVDAESTQSAAQSVSIGQETNAALITTSITIGTIEIQHNPMTKQKQLGYRKKQSMPKEVVVNASSSDDALPNNVDLSAHYKKKNNRSTKSNNSNNNRMDDDMPNSTITLSPQTESSKATSYLSESFNKTETSEEAFSKVNNHSKSQAQRKVGRNQQANNNNKLASKYHASDAVMWAPVRPQIKNETSSHEVGEKNTVSESTKPSEKSGNDMHNGLKTKRAEMERYVPKPVAKELSQQANSQQIPPNLQAVETVDNSKQNKHGRTYNAWCQQAFTESDPAKNVQISSINDDGWNDNSDNVCSNESLNSSVAPKSCISSNKQRRQPYKAHKVPVSNYTATDNYDQHATSDKSDHKIPLMRYNERNENPNANAEHVKPRWQPKSRVKQKDALQRIENVNGDENTSSQKTIVAEVRESQNQEFRRERKVSEFANSNASYNREQGGRGQRGYNPNYGNQDDKELHFHANDGDKRNNNSNNPCMEYQRVGSYDKHGDSFEENPKFGGGAREGSRVPGSRYRGRGRNITRGGGQFYGRGMGISARVGNAN